MSKIMQAFMPYGSTQIGTPLYMGPEIFKRDRYDMKIDVWALGCVLFEMLCLKPAFGGNNIHEFKNNIFKGTVPDSIPSTYSDEIKNIIKKLLCVYPRHRPSITSLLNNTIIRKHLENRRLELFLDSCITPAFYVKCVVPRSHAGWTNIINTFVSLNNTITLDKSAEYKFNMLNEAKSKLSKQNDDISNKLANIDLNISTLQKNILNAKKYIEECEGELELLYKTKLQINDCYMSA